MENKILRMREQTFLKSTQDFQGKHSFSINKFCHMMDYFKLQRVPKPTKIKFWNRKIRFLVQLETSDTMKFYTIKTRSPVTQLLNYNVMIDCTDVDRA